MNQIASLPDRMTGQDTSTLSGVPETLLITLAARLTAARQNPDLHFVDPAAEAVGRALAFDSERFAGDKASMRGSVVRGQWLDGVVAEFIQEHPHGLILSVGSGLDTRANRLSPPPGIDWIDLDFPEVVALRNALVPALPNVRALAADATDVAAWSGSVGWEEGRPVLVVAEGVSMYLDPIRALSWLQALAAKAVVRGSALWLALDLASPLMVAQSHRHPSVSKTGAKFSWGVRRPEEVSRAVPELRLVETYDVARHCGAASAAIAFLYRVLTLGRPVYSCALFRNS